MKTRTMTFGENDDAHRCEMNDSRRERRVPQINLVVLISTSRRMRMIRVQYVTLFKAFNEWI